MKQEKRCPGYVGISCVDGNCPVALRDEYEEYGIPLVENCKNCSRYRGCEDCAWEGTEYCIMKEDHDDKRGVDRR